MKIIKIVKDILVKLLLWMYVWFGDIENNKIILSISLHYSYRNLIKNDFGGTVLNWFEICLTNW